MPFVEPFISITCKDDLENVLDLGELGCIREDYVVRWSYCGGNFCNYIP